MTKATVRCAIYTRKSSEEGLDQSFNSLDAQREACRAFILSQKNEGWTALDTRYDDGGFSGGSMDRPALKQLLEDIQAGKMDTVVVYKVDRLTRSLTDFSKIIEIFDARSVSFVSVTQHFNTTNSMGRLTLNVLLSFAQFEREITGERIRDKIAASKKKGMWMGGVVPLGYECVNHRLVIKEPEAEVVRDIFQQYLRLGCVAKLKALLDKEQIRSKSRTSSTGRTSGGKAYSRGALYHLLSNRVYIGEIVHHSTSYQGQHQAIVRKELWEQVSVRLQENNRGKRSGKSGAAMSLLTGKLFDSHGVRFTPTAALKNGKKYRYYTSQTVIARSGTKPSIARFSAEELESLVKSQVRLLLEKPERITAGIEDSQLREVIAQQSKELAKRWPQQEASEQAAFIRKIVGRVVVGQGTATIEIDQAQLFRQFLGEQHEGISLCENANLKVVCNFRVIRRSNETRLICPDTESCFQRSSVSSLIKTVVRAQNWKEQIIAGEIKTISQLAQQAGVSETYVNRIVQCAYLSPQIVEAILAGRHRPNLTLKAITRGIPLRWQDQEMSFLSTTL